MNRASTSTWPLPWTAAKHAAQRQLLSGFPAVERIQIVRQQGEQCVIAQLGFQHHRRRKATQQRWHRLSRHMHEGEGLHRLAQHQHGVVANGHGLPFEVQVQVAAIVCHQAHGHRDHKRLFDGLPKVGPQCWLKVSV
jgi:hypothetical protein